MIKANHRLAETLSVLQGGAAIDLVEVSSIAFLLFSATCQRLPSADCIIVEGSLHAPFLLLTADTDKRKTAKMLETEINGKAGSDRSSSKSRRSLQKQRTLGQLTEEPTGSTSTHMCTYREVPKAPRSKQSIQLTNVSTRQNKIDLCLRHLMISTNSSQYLMLIY